MNDQETELHADLAAINRVIESLDPQDIIGLSSFKTRRKMVEEKLASMEGQDPDLSLMTRDGVMAWLDHMRLMEKRTGMPVRPYYTASQIAWAMRMKFTIEALAEKGDKSLEALLEGTK